MNGLFLLNWGDVEKRRVDSFKCTCDWNIEVMYLHVDGSLKHYLFQSFNAEENMRKYVSMFLFEPCKINISYKGCDFMAVEGVMQSNFTGRYNIESTIDHYVSQLKAEFRNRGAYFYERYLQSV